MNITNVQELLHTLVRIAEALEEIASMKYKEIQEKTRLEKEEIERKRYDKESAKASELIMNERKDLKKF